MYCTNFEYAGEKLSDYGMIVCSFGGKGLETVSSGADITFAQASPSMSNHFNLYSSNYEEPFSCTFQICKDPKLVHSADEMAISIREMSAVQRWLCRKNRYFKFKIFQEGYEHVYWNATFSAKQINVGGVPIGLEVEMHTDSPYAYMDDIVIEKESVDFLTFDIYDPSDEVGDIRLNLEIEFLENGKFNLINMTTGKITVIDGCEYGEKIIIDGKNCIITTSSSEHLLSNNFNYVFPTITNSYEDNKTTFMCNMPCKIKLSYSPIRKVGL